MSDIDPNQNNPLRSLFGPLPVGRINRALALELEPGDVVFSRRARQHAAEHHPDDFPLCLPFVASVVANPLYVGDDFRNDSKIELICRIPALGSGLLVAISVRRDPSGLCRIASIYPISDRKIANRLDKGLLIRA